MGAIIKGPALQEYAKTINEADNTRQAIVKTAEFDELYPLAKVEQKNKENETKEQEEFEFDKNDFDKNTETLTLGRRNDFVNSIKFNLENKEKNINEEEKTSKANDKEIGE